jgi:hypothetical protein
MKHARESGGKARRLLSELELWEVWCKRTRHGASEPEVLRGACAWASGQSRDSIAWGNIRDISQSTFSTRAHSTRPVNSIKTPPPGNLRTLTGCWEVAEPESAVVVRLGGMLSEMYRCTRCVDL